MPKGFNVDDILDEFEAKRRPKAPAPTEGSGDRPAPRQPFKLKNFTDTAEILPQKRREEAGPDLSATRIDIPIAASEPRPDLGRTQVLDRGAILTAQEPDKPTAAPEDAGETDDRRERFRKFASMTAIPPDDDMDDEDEESFMLIGARKKKHEPKPAKTPKTPKAPKANGGGLFKRGAKTEVAPPAPIDEEAAPVLDEFTAHGDAKLIERDLRALRTGLILRLVTSLIGFAALLYLSLMSAFPDSVPMSGFATEQPGVYMGAQVAILALLCIVSNRVVGGGVLALFRLKATNDTPLAFAALAALGLGVALAVNPSPLVPGYTAFYFASVAAGFFFNALGKIYMVSRIAANFTLAQAEEITCMVPVDASIGGHLGGRSAVLPVRTRLAGDFLAISYSDDLAENLSRITAPIFLGFSLVIGLISFFLFGDAMLALTAVTAMLVMAAPLTATLCGSLPFYRAGRKLAPEESAICGHSAIDLFEDTDALIVEVADLFPQKSVVLHGIKSFAEGRIDQAIVAAASVMCETGGLLSEVFLQVIGGRRDMLGKVTSATYEDGRGLRAMVDGEAVFIGNRDLMRAHGIAAPSKDYEEKFIGEDKDILYLANANEVTAMFVIGYHPDPDLAPQLHKLTGRGVMLLVKTTDPNLTAERIAAAYNLRAEYVRTVPTAVAAMLPDQTVQDSQPAYIMVGEGIRQRLRVVAAIHTLRGSVVAATSIQLIGMILGYALIAFCAFMGATNAIGFVQILIYQLCWALLSAIAACIGRV